MLATRVTPFVALPSALAILAALGGNPGNEPVERGRSHSRPAGLSVSATCDGASAAPDDTLSCRVRISNTGGTELTGLFLLHYPYQTDRPTPNYAGYPPCSWATWRRTSR